jgi:hypothetical protein
MSEQLGKPEELDDDDSFEIEVVDDTPEADKGRPRRPEGAEPEVPSDEEVENYSESVKKRISKLKFEFHEERRQKEEALRIQQEAIAFAQSQRQQLETMQRRLADGDTALIAQAQARLKSQLDQVQAKMKMAYEAGDSDAFVTANAELAGLKAEESRLSTYRPAPQRPAQPVQQPVQQRPQVPEPSTKAKMWASDNEWFGKDEEMTALAFGVHERVIRQGVAPDSEEYYSAIDSAVRQRFPDKFAAPKESTPRRQMGSVVAPGGRSSAPTPRKVTLTATQVALAKKLGLKPEQYAAQLMKEQRNG